VSTIDSTDPATPAAGTDSGDRPPPVIRHACHACHEWLDGPAMREGQQVLVDAGCDVRDAGALCAACARRWATSRLFRLRLQADRASPDWWRRRCLGLPGASPVAASLPSTKTCSFLSDIKTPTRCTHPSGTFCSAQAVPSSLLFAYGKTGFPVLQEQGIAEATAAPGRGSRRRASRPSPTPRRLAACPWG